MDGGLGMVGASGTGGRRQVAWSQIRRGRRPKAAWMEGWGWLARAEAEVDDGWHGRRIQCDGDRR